MEVQGSPLPTTFTIDTFKILVQGGDLTIGNLVASDATSTVVPYIDGLSNGLVLSDGVEYQFSLITPLTGGVGTELTYSFEIAETGEAFSVFYRFTSN